jgi:hypothetical protein
MQWFSHGKIGTLWEKTFAGNIVVKRLDTLFLFRIFSRIQGLKTEPSSTEEGQAKTVHPIKFTVRKI